MKKRILVALLSFVMIAALTGCNGNAHAPASPTNEPAPAPAETASPAEAGANTASVNFPTHDINAYLTWGAGGGLDTTFRALTPHVEKELGYSVVVQNKTGASGAVACQFVYDQKSDGYSIFGGAESPTMFNIMDLSKLDYRNYTPLIIYCVNPSVLLVSKDSPYNTLEELFDAIKANPNKITMATTGAAAIPEIYGNLFKNVEQMDFRFVPFEGENAAGVAVMGGNADFTVITSSNARELVRSGDLRALAVLDKNRTENAPDAPPLNEIYPQYEEYLPIAAFFGAYVKNDTPAEVVTILTDAFQKAANTEEYKQFLAEYGVVPAYLSGDEASQYCYEWSSKASYIMYDAGVVDTDPAEYGLERISK